MITRACCRNAILNAAEHRHGTASPNHRQVGRVIEPWVSRTAAQPAISPTAQNSTRLKRLTLIPENQALVGLLPMARRSGDQVGFATGR